MRQLESSWHARSVDHVLTYSRTTNRGRISVTFTNYEAKDLLRKNLHELRSKRLVAQVSQTRRFALYLRTGVVLILQLESSWHGRSVDHVLTYFRREIAVGSQKPSQITRQKTCCAGEVKCVGLRCICEPECGKSRSDLRNLQRIMRQKTCCASESNTSVRVVFANQSGFDAPIGVVLAWEERGSCLNIFRTIHRGRISETFTNYEAKDLLSKCVKHVGSRCILRTGVILMLQLESSWHGRSVDHLLTYSGRQIAVGYQKTSRITRQKTCCATNRSGFDAPIGVVLAWEERGSCLNIFQTTNRGRISETFTNYEAKDLLRK
ncbi:uncharacterized protein G2W53_026237 [Senna tora]|uniref:Uncharacterized protein n=1 Tax=Senna tora TaxID=362788 RepID=A0A834TEP1_9FABA|nr:uncharacterized protein G2W53_026237 [Senna tora]